MLVGSSYGGAAAAEIAAAATSQAFVVDQVVTAGAPSAQVPSIPEQTRVLSLEDRADPVALLGSLINANVANRVTVVYDGSTAGDTALRRGRPRGRRGPAPRACGPRSGASRSSATSPAESRRDPSVDIHGRFRGHPARKRPVSPMDIAETNSSSWVRLRHSTIGTISP